VNRDGLLGIKTAAEAKTYFNRLRQVSQPPHDAVIRVYDETGNVIETHQDKGDFREPFAT